MTTVAIVDDHLMVRKGVEFVLGSCGDEFKFVGEHGGGEGAAEFAQRVCADVLLLDIRMPDKDGLVALREILAARPEQKVVMLTTSDADNDVYEALRSGAKGYLLKGRDSDRLAETVRTVASGQEFVPDEVRGLYEIRASTGGLSQRETEVLNYMAKGFTVSDIASLMNVSYDTVKSYARNVYTKLDVSDRVTAVTEAYRRGFLRRQE